MNPSVSVAEGRCDGEDSPDKQHCNCWWDGDACHYCGAPEMSMDQMVEQGMAEGPVRNPNG